MVRVECHELEGVAVAAPGADVVVGPVAVVEVHLGEHVLGEAAQVDFFFKLFVLLVVFAGKVAVGDRVHDACEFLRRRAVRAACRPAVYAVVVAVAVLDHVDRLGVDSVVGLDKASVQAFAHVVDAEVFAIVEHHHLAATLVVHFGAFQQASHHGVGNVVGPVAVTVVAQVERLDFLSLGACLEQGVFQHLVAVVVVVHLDGDALLGLVAAVVSHDRNACVDFPVLFGGGASVFEEFHMDGEFVFAPEVGLLAGLGTLGVVLVGGVRVVPRHHSALVVGQGAGGVKAVGGVEHVVVIHGERHDGHRDGLVNKVGLRGGVGCLSVHEFGAADHCVLGNLLCLCNLFGTLRGEGSVEGAADFTALLRCGRVNGQVGVETSLGEECCLSLVVVVVVLEPARRGPVGWCSRGAGKRGRCIRVGRVCLGIAA